MVAASIVHANADKLDDYKIDDDNGIIAVEDIPQQPPHAPLIVNDTEDNGDNNAAWSGNVDNVDVDVDEDEDYDDSLDEDDNNELAAATDAQEGNKSDGNQGLRRLRRRGKGTSKKYANYSLLMASKRATVETGG